MSEDTRPPTHAGVIGAIRLAVEAGATDAVRVKVLRELLGMAPPTLLGDVEPVELLVTAIQATKTEWHITDNNSRIRRRRVPAA